MGCLVQYDCTNPACRYTVQFSGGEDSGFLVKVRSMTCLDCPGLVDVVIGERKKKFEPDPVDPKCPECGSKNLKIFHPGRTRCPKCRSRLRENREFFGFWD